MYVVSLDIVNTPAHFVADQTLSGDMTIARGTTSPINRFLRRVTETMSNLLRNQIVDWKEIKGTEFLFSFNAPP